MDARRVSRAAIDPKVRRVGFFASRSEPEPDEPDSSPRSDSPPASNPVSPVTLPPPLRHFPERTAAVPVPESGFRRQASGDLVPIGSYNPFASLLGTSPAASGVGMDDGQFSENSNSGWFLRSESNFPGGGFDMPAAKPPEYLAEKDLALGVNVKNLVAAGTGKSLLH